MLPGQCSLSFVVCLTALLRSGGSGLVGSPVSYCTTASADSANGPLRQTVPLKYTQ